MISGDRAAEEPFPLFAHTATHSTVDEIEKNKNDEIDDDHVFWAIKKSTYLFIEFIKYVGSIYQLE